MREFGCLHDFCFCRTLISVGDIVVEALVEEERFLRDVGDVITQRGLCDVADVLSVDRYRTTLYIEKTKEEFRDGGLASATWSDESDFLIALDTEVKF